MDILRHNHEAWNKEVEEGNIWTKPVDSRTIEEAKKRAVECSLTSTKPVPAAWFPKLDGEKVFCLASEGGQQAPVLAAVGAEVTVFDNSPSQLERDRRAMKSQVYIITCSLTTT